jgi:hypothetical protein
VGKRKNNTLKGLNSRITGKKKPILKRDCNPIVLAKSEYGISVMNTVQIFNGWRAFLKALQYPRTGDVAFITTLIATSKNKSLTSDFISNLVERIVTSLAMEKHEAKEDTQEEANKPCLCGLYDAPVLAVAPVAKPYKA